MHPDNTQTHTPQQAARREHTSHAMRVGSRRSNRSTNNNKKTHIASAAFPSSIHPSKVTQGSWWRRGVWDELAVTIVTTTATVVAASGAVVRDESAV